MIRFVDMEFHKSQAHKGTCTIEATSRIKYHLSVTNNHKEVDYIKTDSDNKPVHYAS